MHFTLQLYDHCELAQLGKVNPSAGYILQTVYPTMFFWEQFIQAWWAQKTQKILFLVCCRWHSQGEVRLWRRHNTFWGRLFLWVHRDTSLNMSLTSHHGNSCCVSDHNVCVILWGKSHWHQNYLWLFFLVLQWNKQINCLVAWWQGHKPKCTVFFRLHCQQQYFIVGLVFMCVFCKHLCAAAFVP